MPTMADWSRHMMADQAETNTSWLLPESKRRGGKFVSKTDVFAITAAISQYLKSM
jgi:hypothetical protein